VIGIFAKHANVRTYGVKYIVYTICTCLLLISSGEHSYATIEGADDNKIAPTTKNSTGGLSPDEKRRQKSAEGGIFDNIFPDKKKSDGTVAPAVNHYLWFAALETLSFMPLYIADPFAGVIVSDWQIFQDKSDERVKVQVTITGSDLHPSNLRVSLNRQTLHGDKWITSATSSKTRLAIENAIFIRTRQMIEADKL